jgi:hypothetical protein
MPKTWKSTMPELIKWEKTLKLLIIEGETPGAFSGDGNGKIKLHQNQAQPIDFLHELMHKLEVAISHTIHFYQIPQFFLAFGAVKLKEFKMK